MQRRRSTIVILPLLVAAASACAPGTDSTSDGTGGATSSSGGNSPGSGGTVGTGGRTSGTGGGSSSSGGTTGASGGTTGTGGSTGSGGSAAGTGGRSSSGGSTASSGGAGGRVGTGGGGGGVAATGGAGGRSGSGGTTGSGGATGSGGGGVVSTERFSFFVTSIEAIRSVSGSQDGFGGNLKQGEATGLAGADKICTTIANMSMPNNGKTWRAFLSTFGPPAINAIDRVGAGPWYDRMGRTVAMTKAALAAPRPMGAHTAIVDDLPNENGIPNHQGVDNHDTLTGSTSAGLLNGANAGATCNDWTSAVGTTGKPMCGHTWPAGSGTSWIQAHAAGGCAPGVNLVQSGGPGSSTTVGAGGGYGGFYCFALQP